VTPSGRGRRGLSLFGALVQRGQPLAQPLARTEAAGVEPCPRRGRRSPAPAAWLGKADGSRLGSSWAGSAENSCRAEGNESGDGLRPTLITSARPSLLPSASIRARSRGSGLVDLEARPLIKAVEMVSLLDWLRLTGLLGARSCCQNAALASIARWRSPHSRSCGRAGRSARTAQGEFDIGAPLQILARRRNGWVCSGASKTMADSLAQGRLELANAADRGRHPLA